MKLKQLHSGFELGWPCPFPTPGTPPLRIYPIYNDVPAQLDGTLWILGVTHKGDCIRKDLNIAKKENPEER